MQVLNFLIKVITVLLLLSLVQPKQVNNIITSTHVSSIRSYLTPGNNNTPQVSYPRSVQPFKSMEKHHQPQSSIIIIIIIITIIEVTEWLTDLVFERLSPPYPRNITKWFDIMEAYN